MPRCCHADGLTYCRSAMLVSDLFSEECENARFKPLAIDPRRARGARGGLGISRRRRMGDRVVVPWMVGARCSGAYDGHRENDAANVLYEARGVRIPIQRDVRE